MCQNVHYIARGDEQHFVGQCEHGTVFLVWRSCTWSFSLGEFVRLSTFVTWAETQPLTELQRGVCSGQLTLRHYQGGVQLGVAEIGLTLTPGDFESLRDLLENASWALKMSPALETSVQGSTAPVAQKVVN